MLAGFSLQSPAGQAQVIQVCRDVGLSPDLWSAVLRARREHTGTRNRRRLFAAFDALFDAPASRPVEGEGQIGTTLSGGPPTDEPERIVLSKLTFKNWKVFGSAEFTFPAYEVDRPVVLIGGKNGYGKTSVLEGLLYGLFGRHATVDLASALSPGGASPTARAAAYKRTLEGALHRPAREQGAGVMSVRSEWLTGEGELIVERRWYFSDDGVLTDDDEGLNLWIGPDKEVLAVPEGEDPGVFYQDEIARRLMPPSLAAFVLFDGEQVRQFAQRDFADQVRVAVETVLGLTVWREAIADLRDYARDRAKGALRSEDGEQASVEKLSELQGAERGLLDAIDTVQAAAAPLRARRDDVLASLGSLTVRTYATMSELLERRQALAVQHQRTRHELALAASNELPLRLVGETLRARLRASLEADRALDGLAGPWAEPSSLDRLLAALGDELPSKDQAVLEGALRRAWATLADPRNAGEARRHAYVSGPTREAALARLNSAAHGSVAGLADLAQSLEAEQTEIDDAITTLEARDQASASHRQELEAVTRDLEIMDEQRRTLDQALGRIQSQLKDLGDTMEARLVARMSDAQQIGRRRAALDVAQAGEALIEALKPHCFEAVGAAVTDAYAALAHKGLVSRITIDPEGRVVLVDGRGIDVRAIEASAGESQIFAMALMAAVAQLAGRRLPSIIDTPLGRLDPDHRARVLAFFTTRDVQTILLSQPDEVNRHYLALIEDRVAARFHLRHSLAAGGPGGSAPVEGYFPEIAA